MGKASRKKREVREAHRHLAIDPSAKRLLFDWEGYEQKTALIRGQMNKFVSFSLMYGANPMNMAGAAQQRKREHPLEGFTAFKYVTRADARFGHVAVYKANTKIMGQIMRGIHVPGTDVWAEYIGNLQGSLGSTGAICIAWCRRNRIEDIQHAVAWVLMQDKVPVVVRAFEP